MSVRSRLAAFAAAGALLPIHPAAADEAGVLAFDVPPRHQYVGIKKCKTCHGKELYGDQVAVWRKGPHAKALESLESEKAIEYARERGIVGPPSEADDCLLCHATGHAAGPTWIKYELDPADGVQCESCHGPGVDYRKKSIMSNGDDALANGMVRQSEAVCVICHNDESPAWDPTRYNGAGGPSGFDYATAVAKIAHPTPEEVKGRVAEIEEEEKRKKKAGK